MMSPNASKLDSDKFSKVRALMIKGATEGERKAARAAATKMAHRAGLTLDQAISQIHTAPAPAPAPVSWPDIFAGVDDRMEEREPGYKARVAAEKTARKERRDVERAQLLQKYGSEEAVFADTERERLLEEALMPIADQGVFHGSDETHVNGYSGWTAGEPNEALWTALKLAYPFPDDLPGVWAEYLMWEALQEARNIFDENASPAIFVRARTAALEHLMDVMPAPSWLGLRARIAWLCRVSSLDFYRQGNEDLTLARTLGADFEGLFAAVQNGQPNPSDNLADTFPARRTNADKRRDVLSMLDAEPGLSDREIGRRCGVSPQTAGNWRRRR